MIFFSFGFGHNGRTASPDDSPHCFFMLSFPTMQYLFGFYLLAA